MGEPESIGIRELRQHASRYVAVAKQGRRVPVTDRGELVAYLVPAHEPDTTFQRLVAAGQVRLPEASVKDALASWEPLAAEPGEKTLSQVLVCEPAPQPVAPLSRCHPSRHRPDDP